MIWPMVPWVRGASPRSPSGKSSRLAVKKCLFMVNVVTLIQTQSRLDSYPRDDHFGVFPPLRILRDRRRIRQRHAPNPRPAAVQFVHQGMIVVTQNPWRAAVVQRAREPPMISF